MKKIFLFSLLLFCAVGCQESTNNRPVTFADRLELAEGGDADVQNEVAMAFLLGNGTQQDLERALHWFQTAADADHSRALYNLGILYQQGQYVSQDYRLAYDYFMKAAKRGFPEAQMSLGWLYERGLGTGKNLEEAVYWYRRSATFGKAAMKSRSYYQANLLAHRDSQYLHGNKDAQFLLGKLFENGEQGVNADVGQAVEWYEDAAVRGDLASANRLAVLLGLQGSSGAERIMGYGWAKYAVSVANTENTQRILSAVKRSLTPEMLVEAEAESAKLIKLIQYNEKDL